MKKTKLKPKPKPKPEEAKVHSLQFPDEQGGLTARVSHPSMALIAGEFVKYFKRVGAVNFAERR